MKKTFRLENVGYICTILNFKCRYVRHMIKKFIKLNDNVSELDGSIEVALATITPEMCR